MSAGSSGGEGYFSSRYSRIASDWNSVVPSSSTSAGSAICGLILRYSGSRCALASRSTNTTSTGTFFRLSAIRTRKLANDRQKEKNFMGDSALSSLLPQGEKGRKGSGPHRLLSPRQVHGTSASRRMRGHIIGRHDFRHWRLRRFLRRNIIQHRRQPAFGLGHAHALARGVVLDLVALDLADAEIEAFGVREVKSRHRRARPHCKALRQIYAGRVLGVEQRKQRCLLRVIGLSGIAGRRADAGILLEDQLIRGESFVRRIAPEFLADALVHPLGKGFREAIGQRLAQDRGVIVIGVLEAIGDRVLADPGRDYEAA